MNAEILIAYSCDNTRCGGELWRYDIFMCPNCGSPRIDDGRTFDFTLTFMECIQYLEYRQSQDEKLSKRYSELIERLFELIDRLSALRYFYYASDINRLRDSSVAWPAFYEKWYAFSELYTVFRFEFDEYEEFKVPRHMIF